MSCLLTKITESYQKYEPKKINKCILLFKKKCSIQHSNNCTHTSQDGAHSATITSNFRSIPAFLKKDSTTRDLPIVIIISFE